MTSNYDIQLQNKFIDYMRLYVIDKYNNTKVYIGNKAVDRNDLYRQIGSFYINVNGLFYTINEVRAESSKSESVAVGVIAGAAIGGLLTGGVGLFVGAGIGGLFAGGVAPQDQAMVSRFNNTFVNIP